MKKICVSIILCITLLSLVSCEIEPVFTFYNERVHQSVQKYYDEYEILSFIRLEKDGYPTLHNFCIIKNATGGIDVICISYARSEENYDDYISTDTVIATNIEFGKTYSTGYVIKDIAVEYVICKKKDIPKSVLQRELFRIDGQKTYFCIVNIEDTSI